MVNSEQRKAGSRKQGAGMKEDPGKDFSGCFSRFQLPVF
jgi:hypothetical protein